MAKTANVMLWIFYRIKNEYKTDQGRSPPWAPEAPAPSRRVSPQRRPPSPTPASPDLTSGSPRLAAPESNQCSFMKGRRHIGLAVCCVQGSRQGDRHRNLLNRWISKVGHGRGKTGRLWAVSSARRVPVSFVPGQLPDPSRGLSGRSVGWTDVGVDA